MGSVYTVLRGALWLLAQPVVHSFSITQSCTAPHVLQDDSRGDAYSAGPVPRIPPFAEIAARDALASKQQAAGSALQPDQHTGLAMPPSRVSDRDGLLPIDRSPTQQMSKDSPGTPVRPSLIGSPSSVANQQESPVRRARSPSRLGLSAVMPVSSDPSAHAVKPTSDRPTSSDPADVDRDHLANDLIARLVDRDQQHGDHLKDSSSMDNLKLYLSKMTQAEASGGISRGYKQAKETLKDVSKPVSRLSKVFWGDPGHLDATRQVPTSNTASQQPVQPPPTASLQAGRARQLPVLKPSPMPLYSVLPANPVPERSVAAERAVARPPADGQLAPAAAVVRPAGSHLSNGQRPVVKNGLRFGSRSGTPPPPSAAAASTADSEDNGSAGFTAEQLLSALGCSTALQTAARKLMRIAPSAGNSPSVPAPAAPAAAAAAVAAPADLPMNRPAVQQGKFAHVASLVQTDQPITASQRLQLAAKHCPTGLFADAVLSAVRQGTTVGQAQVTLSVRDVLIDVGPNMASLVAGLLQHAVQAQHLAAAFEGQQQADARLTNRQQQLADVEQQQAEWHDTLCRREEECHQRELSLARSEEQLDAIRSWLTRAGRNANRSDTDTEHNDVEGGVQSKMQKVHG